MRYATELFEEHFRWLYGLEADAKPQKPLLPIGRKSPANFVRVSEYTFEKWE